MSHTSRRSTTWPAALILLRANTESCTGRWRRRVGERGGDCENDEDDVDDRGDRHGGGRVLPTGVATAGSGATRGRCTCGGRARRSSARSSGRDGACSGGSTGAGSGPRPRPRSRCTAPAAPAERRAAGCRSCPHHQNNPRAINEECEDRRCVLCRPGRADLG